MLHPKSKGWYKNIYKQLSIVKATQKKQKKQKIAYIAKKVIKLAIRSIQNFEHNSNVEIIKYE